MTEPHHPPPDPADRHLWEFSAVRDLTFVILGLCVLGVIYWLRALIAPIVVAFALAYAVDPIVRSAQQRLRLTRVQAAIILMLFVLAAVTGFAIWLVPEFIEQIGRLMQRAPSYWRTLVGPETARQLWNDFTSNGQAPTATSPADDPQAVLEQLDLKAVMNQVVTGTGYLFGFVGTVVDTGAYLVMAGVLIIVLFFSFSARLDRLGEFDRFLPAGYRPLARDVADKLDIAFSGYIRGQLLVALFTTTGFCVGFWLIGVPYWFVVGLIGGILSLIPYGQSVGWLLAMLMKYLETQTGDVSVNWVSILLAPSMVYAVTQSMETWLITPWVQSESLNLHPMTVIVVLLIGGSLAGIVGLVLAIPLTATANMLFADRIRDRWLNWAENH